MAFKSFNPFYRIIETTKFPHARTLRTSLWQKLWDTFGVFAGNEDHPGLLHYLTFFIIIPIDFLVALAWESMDSDEDMIGMLLILAVPLQLVYYTAAALLTLVVSPMVGVIHLVGRVGRYFSEDYNSEQALQEIHGTTDFSEKNKFTSGFEQKKNIDMSLQESLSRHHLTTDDIEVTCVTKKRAGDYYSFTFSKKEEVEHGSNDYKFKTKMPSDDDAATNRKYLATFFRLNIAGVTEYCEELDQNQNMDIVDTFTGRVSAARHG